MTDETLFAEAMEKATAAERAEYLDAACASAEQRARVDSLLAAHDKAGSFLGRPAVGDDGSGDTTRATPDDGGTHTFDPDDHPADETDLSFLAPPSRPDSLGRIGQYDVLEVLGRGGFGIVFRAFDDKLQRVVAVKVLAPHMAATSPARKRFLREARSAAAVRHENVVQIHAVEEQPLPHLVMEYIPGATLQERLDGTGPLDSAEALRIGRQIADGLAAAHAQGLIHRDIKPSNILIGAGSNATAKITDFGLARAADDASLTRSGAVAGTPMYMAPEQARGETLDHRADLFSLGSVLYVMLSGRPPFRANSTLAVLKRVADDTPRPIREIIPEVPAWLCRIVEKLHAKDPAERFQTAREVADLLADCEKQLTERKELTDFTRIPVAKAVPMPKRKGVPARGLVALPAIVLLLFVLALWFGRPAWLLATGRGALDIHPADGLVSVIVLQNDEGDLETDKLHPPVTDWLGMKEKSHSLTLPPGRYQLNVGTYPAGTAVAQWEVTTSDLFGSRTTLVPVVRTSAIIPVGRGERVTIRPKMIHRPTPPDPGPSHSSDGFTPLFDGKTLAGWTEFPAGRGSWTVKNGVLVGKGKPSHLFTERDDFANFHLRIDLRVRQGTKAGAIGVFGRVPVEDPGMVISPHGEGSLYRQPVPKLYDDTAPPPKPPPPSYREKPIILWGGDLKADSSSPAIITADEWLTYELIVDEGHVSIIAPDKNRGSKSMVYSGVKAQRGHLALQLFDDWSAVEIRKIEVKELPLVGGPPAEPKRTADFLPFVRGTWSRDGEIIEPKAKAARVGGQVAFTPVAGGTLLRGLNVDEHAVPTSLVLHKYDPATDKLSSWYFAPDGTTNNSDAGDYDPTTRLFTWLEKSPDGAQSVHNLTVVDGNTVEARHHDTDAGGKFVFKARAKFTRSNLPPVVPKVSIDPKRPDEMKVLDRLIGDWRTEITTGVNGMSPPPDSWRTTARATLGGRFVEVFSENTSGKGGEYAVVWYDRAAKCYRQWYFNGDGHTFPLTGTWDATTSTLKWETADKTKSGHWAFKADGWEFRRAITDGKGKELSAVTGVSRPTGSPNAEAAELKKEVAAREKARDHAKERVEAQVANKRELFAAEAAVLEARVKVAEAEGKAGEAADLLEKLVDQRKQDREFVALRVNAGMDAPAVLDAADAKLADAKARLAKARPPK